MLYFDVFIIFVLTMLTICTIFNYLNFDIFPRFLATFVHHFSINMLTDTLNISLNDLTLILDNDTSI